MMPRPFADPDVSSEVKEQLRGLAIDEGPIAPWDLLEVAESEGMAEAEAQKALRALKLTDELVPAGDFTGELRLADDDS